MKNDDDMADALKDDSGAFDIKKMGAGVPDRLYTVHCW